jgi:hypothetical protein
MCASALEAVAMVGRSCLMGRRIVEPVARRRRPLAVCVAVLCGACTTGSHVVPPISAMSVPPASSAPLHELSCPPPEAVPLGVESIPDARKLSGIYELTVVADKNAANVDDPAVRGRLELWPTDRAHRHPPTNPEITYLLPGATDADLERLGPVSLAYSPASRDPDWPGVQVKYSRGELSLLVGNAFGPKGAYMDAGVMFSVTVLDDAGFRGYWKDGGYLLDPPSGYFCARRVSK